MTARSNIADGRIFKALWSCDLSMELLGLILGVSTGAVGNAASRFGYPTRTEARRNKRRVGRAKPGPRGRKPEAAVKEGAPARMRNGPIFGDNRTWSKERDDQLILSMGRYERIRVLAGCWDLPETQLQQRWNQIRDMGGA